MATPLSSKKNVRVLYDYNYEEKDGSRVSIKSGDECILVKKTDDDWWLVLRCGEKKGIFVPANYLQEIHMTTIVVGGGCSSTGPPKVKPKPAKPPPIPKKPKPPLVEDDVLKAFDNMLEHAFDGDSCDSLDEPPPDYDDDKTEEAKKCDNDEGDAVEDDSDYINVVPKVKAKTDANANRVKRREPTENYENVPFKSEKSADTVDEPDPDYENVSTGHRRSQNTDSERPQQPKEGATADRILIGGWEQHCDEEGRTFYFNPVTKQSQWEPPGGSRGSSDSDRLSESSRRSLRRMTSIPLGWTEERSDTGDIRFVNEVTKERWQSSVDELGRIYYFQENSSGESSWDLPENPATVAEPESGETRPETDGASGPSSPRISSGPSTEGNGSRPVAARLKELKGTLYKKKLMENNKKLKKNWSQSFVATTGQMLYFYKDQKAANPKSNQPVGKPEVTIDLRDTEIKFGSEAMYGKKNVLMLKTHSGTDEYLLQCDSKEIHEWYQTLCGNIESLSKCIDRPTTLLRQISVDTLPSSDTNQRSPSTESAPSTLGRKKAHSKERMTATLERTNNSGSLTFTDDTDNSRGIKEWLSNWFKKRPPVETLRAKGILQDAVFGSHLMSLCILDNSPVPHFVTGCIAAIENRGLQNDGIYRVSGNLAEIQKLKFCVNQDHDFDLVNSEFDLHVLTGALKMFFRELKEPLFPFNMFDKFMSAVKTQNKSMKAQMFRDLIKVLPPANKETMRTLFEHLLRVIDCSQENRMQIQNVAIVFGPTLLSPEQPAENITMTLVLQNQIVDFILHEFKRLF